MDKAQLRKKALEQRKGLSEAEAASYSLKLLEGFKTLNLSFVKSIHLFLPILERKEPDTFLIIDWLTVNYPTIEIIVPSSEFATNLMKHHTYPGRENLALNAYNIPEPQNEPLSKVNPDLVIVPLLAFDENGNRVGYGKGFYDRFLQSINAEKIGLSFFAPVSEISDVNLYDVKLDKCITPDGIFVF
ncbi:MAG: 5-formyltetrahydrofolate cyclo-ligase [Pedobacter sp.]|nr:MAG: 5-formyltetrahydrofolate cyclo-ligase [Pedobacter sp.]